MSNFTSTSVILKISIVLLFSCFSFLARAQIVSTIAGNGVAGFVDGTLLNAEFNGCNGVVINKTGVIFIADRFNNSYRKVTTTKVSTLAGNGIAGYINGTGTNAEFNAPAIGIALDKNGNLFVSDQLNSVIRKITPSGIVTTFAGDGTFGFKDGTGTNAEFNAPRGLVFDTLGNLFVADEFNNSIRKITSAGVVTTVAGSTQAGYLNGIGTNARFNDLSGLAIDKAGNLYVGETGNSDIRKISPLYVVTTVAGNQIAGYKDGNANEAEFNDPRGIAIDKQNNLYVCDFGNNRIREITTLSIVTTYAGDGVEGFKDGNADSAEFSRPVGLTIDSLDNLIVADNGNNRIRKITQGSLPITLLQFTAQLSKNNCILSWQTATELNTSYFNIQRSSDGLHYNTINKINAAGNSSNTKNYSYSDVGVNELSVSKLYYRLQEVDKDGKSNYSNIRTVNLLNWHSLFSVSPNPSKDFIHITASYNVSAAQVNITDMNGKTLFTTQQNFVAGQQLKVLLSQFPSGVLIVNIKSSNSNEKLKIIKE